MVIQILNGGRGREINAAIMAQALLAGCKLYASNPFVSFRVAEWSEFLHIVWKAYCECSRDGRGSLMYQRMPVHVTLDDAREYDTLVWYDEVDRSLKYVSLV
ncbi:MAG: hypothetical protein II452_02540 [Paludibacteraceae bacterium]|nr:hypothetical protein [Paludibacteraceae bacterium]